MDDDDLKSLDEFASQQLNDTRYASLLAVRYTGLLYGAGASGVDPEGRRRVEASRGAVTALLRGAWGLNGILGGGEKTRDDHRQHAVDAVVTALTDAATIKRLSEAAARGMLSPGQRLGRMEAPWPGLLEEVREAVEGMVVSHRVSRKVASALHEETVYSRPHADEEGKEYAHIRERLEALSQKDIASIVDPAVRECVRAKLRDLGQTDPKKAFKELKNHPALRAKNGREIPVHKARIRRSETTECIGGEGAYARRVKLGSNHHVEIVETVDKGGQQHWEGRVVSTYEAMKRLKERQPVVKRDHGPGKEFKFSLAGGEIIELDAEQSKRELYIIRTISVTKKGYPGLEFVRVSDARKKGTKGEKGTMKGEGGWYTAAIDALRKRGCRKVTVTPLGEVRRARD